MAAVIAAGSALAFVASAGTATAAAATPVPVAGVPSFGLGSGQLQSPAGVAVDRQGDVFVADLGNRVLEFPRAADGTYPKAGVTVAGTGTAGAGLNQLSRPNGVAVDASGNLFVADSGNSRVLEFAYNSATHSYAASGTVVAGAGGQGSGAGQLNDPGAVALDAKNDLFVADSSNNRVLEFPLNAATGAYPATGTAVAGTGGKGNGTNQLYDPSSIALNAKGDLFIADSINGRVMDYPIDQATGAYPANGTVVSTFSNLAQWVAVDPSGDLFASYGYLGYNSVLEFAYNAGTGTLASTGTPIAAGEMVAPMGMAFDSAGDLFAANAQVTSNPSNSVWNMVVEYVYGGMTGSYQPLGTVMSQTGRSNIGVSSVALDSHGNLFAADSSVYEFPYSAASNSYAVKGTLITTSAGPLAFDGADNLFVGTGAGVLKYAYNSSTGGYPATGSPVPGATQLASLSASALAFDARNDLFVSSATQVLEFPYNAATGSYAATGTVRATATGGTTAYPGVGGIALDTAGDLFVSDSGNNRVQEYLYNPATGGYASTGITVAGVGGSSTATLLEPMQLAVDRSGNLFVYDGGNARILEFTGNAATASYGANGSVVFAGGKDNYPESGGVALDAAGDVFFGFNLDSAVVYKAPAAGTPPPVAPTVTAVSPATGPAAGGTVVTVTGSNLAGGSVAFGATQATAVTCTASSCTATSPAGSGTVHVTVTTTAGTSTTSNADQFTYQTTPPRPPAVTAISPSSGPAKGGTVVTITGSNLAGGRVAFGGSRAKAVTCTASSCTATSPAGSGTVHVTVTTTAGTSTTSTADQFTYQSHR